MTKKVTNKPPQPSKCSLFCCFYAEFDNIIGPKVSHQSPRGFMNQPIDLSFDQIHAILQTEFESNSGNETLEDDVSTTSEMTKEELTAKIAELGETIKGAKADKRPKEEWEPTLNKMLALKVSAIFVKNQRKYMYHTLFCVHTRQSC